MKILILNGNPIVQDENFDKFLNAMRISLQDKGHSVENFVLRNMSIEYCTGCFSCWIKTPGECIDLPPKKWT
ncbi:MAG: flavodoxin family protein [Candidatus Omnitrophica bacterium]|nr:flavodoxin family protein [Candidatus Omnitrophota bacterium]